MAMVDAAADIHYFGGQNKTFLRHIAFTLKHDK